MTDFPYMKMYWADFLADTDHLSNEEMGAYTRLLGNMWIRGCKVPSDDQNLARLSHTTGHKWPYLKPAILPFLTIGNEGKATQKRLGKERAKCLDKSLVNARNARQRWTMKANKNNIPYDANAYANADPNASANGYATRARDRSKNISSSTSHTLPETPPPSTADAAGANPAGPPAIPVTEALLQTRLMKKWKGH